MNAQPSYKSMDKRIYVLEHCYAIWTAGEKEWKACKDHKEKPPRPDERKYGVFNADVDGGCKVDKSDEEKCQREMDKYREERSNPKDMPSLKGRIPQMANTKTSLGGRIRKGHVFAQPLLDEDAERCRN